MAPDRSGGGVSSAAVAEDLEARLARTEAERRALEDAVRLLHRVSALVRSSLELEPTIYAILTGATAGEGLGLNRAMLFLEEGGKLVGAGAVGPKDEEEADRVWRAIAKEKPGLEQLYDAGLAMVGRENRPLDAQVRAQVVDPAADSPVALAFRKGRLVVGEGADDLGGLLHLPTGVAAPLRGPNGPFGVLFADNRFTGRTLEDAPRLVLSMVADHAAQALAVARTFEEVSRSARTDALTGLPHHGALMEALGELVGEGPLGLVMIDVDDFKQINDTHGHPVGDAILARFASRLQSVVRRPEHVYRYGGEEFSVLVPGANAAATAEVAERIREQIAAHRFPVPGGEPLPVTCSLGVAAAPTHGATASALVKRADEALLAAKRAGKNRCAVAG